MSLADALLLEPYRDPREIYIALRNDGQRGSGTMTDPYDGGTRVGSARAATITFDRREILVLGGALGYQVNDTVRFLHIGVAPALEGTDATVTEILSDTQFVARIDSFTSSPPAGPLTPALGKSTQVRKPSAPADDPTTVRLFWPVAKIPRSTALQEIVPFELLEISDTSDPLLSGRFVVVGMTTDMIYVILTTLPASINSPQACSCALVHHRFDERMRTVPAGSVIHLGPGVFETRGFSDLFYVDFNTKRALFHAGFQVKTGQQFRGSGIGATTLRLVHAVDPLAQTLHLSNEGALPVYYFEATDFTLDCDLPCQPVPSGRGFAGVTCGAVGIFGGHNRLRRLRAIRFGTQSTPECFVLVLSSAYSAPETTVNNIIEDCVVEEPSPNNTHETSLIGNVGNAYASALSPVVRNNFTNCEYIKADGTKVSSEIIAVDATAGSYTRVDDNHFTLKTKRPHHRDAGQNVRLNGITIGNDTDPDFRFFENAFEVITATASDLTCFSPNPIPPGTPSLAGSFIGVDFHGPAALSGTGCVTERNAVFDCLNAFYSDTGSTRDAVVRGNFYDNVRVGVNFDFNPVGGGVESPARYARNEDGTYKSLTRDPDDHTVAVFEAATPHFLRVGEAVRVFGARIGADLNPLFNGFALTVVGIVSDHVFKYAVKGILPDDAEAPTNAQPIRFASLWQVRRLFYCNNICDLYAFDSKSALQPRGMSTHGYTPGPPFMFPDAVVRENVFRVPSATPTPFSAGVRFNSSDNYLIEDNVFDVKSENVVHSELSGKFNAFNNITPAGQRLPLAEDVGNNQYEQRDTLEAKVADALLFSLL